MLYMVATMVFTLICVPLCKTAGLGSQQGAKKYKKRYVSTGKTGYVGVDQTKATRPKKGQHGHPYQKEHGSGETRCEDLAF